MKREKFLNYLATAKRCWLSLWICNLWFNQWESWLLLNKKKKEEKSRGYSFVIEGFGGKHKILAGLCGTEENWFRRLPFPLSKKSNPIRNGLLQNCKNVNSFFHFFSRKSGCTKCWSFNATEKHFQFHFLCFSQKKKKGHTKYLSNRFSAEKERIMEMIFCKIHVWRGCFSSRKIASEGENLRLCESNHVESGNHVERGSLGWHVGPRVNTVRTLMSPHVVPSCSPKLSYKIY